MQPPPLLPAQRLRRVLAVSRADGWSVVAVAAASVVIALFQGDRLGTTAAALVTLAGAVELHGRRQLLRGRLSGVGWMIAAQLGLLVVIGTYAWCRWRYFDASALWAGLPGFVRAMVDQELIAAGLEPELDRPFFLGLLNALTCVTLAFVSLLYQGGLAFFYQRNRTALRLALADSGGPPPVESIPHPERSR